MQYQFTFELETPGLEFRSHGDNNGASIKFVGFVDTDSHKSYTSNNDALAYKKSVCGMVLAALANSLPGAKESGFRIELVGFSGDHEVVDASTSLVSYRTSAVPKFIPASDRLIYDKLCGVRGEAWFNVEVLTPAGIWNHNCFNSSNPVKVSWKPFRNAYFKML